MRFTQQELTSVLNTYRVGHDLYPDSFWRHKRTQTVYQVKTLAYDSDRKKVVVQYVDFEARTSQPPYFSHLVDRFLESFERVERTQTWETARG